MTELFEVEILTIERAGSMTASCRFNSIGVMHENEQTCCCVTSVNRVLIQSHRIRPSFKTVIEGSLLRGDVHTDRCKRVFARRDVASRSSFRQIRGSLEVLSSYPSCLVVDLKSLTRFIDGCHRRRGWEEEQWEV